MLTLVSLALAAEPDDDGLETWVGAGLSGGMDLTASSFGSNLGVTDGTTTQAEVDGMIGWGWGHARVDLDLHYDPDAGTPSERLPAYPGPFPEWAMVQLGRETYHARVGIFNPNIGLEDWDPWVNYAPTYSQNFVYFGAGRFAGAELSATTDGGVDLFAFGGYDLDWETVGGGVGVATAQDLYSTWSGVFVYPQFGVCQTNTECLYTGAVVAFEFYPLDQLWVDIDTLTGVRDGSFFSSEQIVLNILPEAAAVPFVRAELLIDPDDIELLPPVTIGAGVTSDPLDWLRIAAEAKSQRFGAGASIFGAALVLSLHVPEPIPYSYQDPFGEAEEE